MRHVITGDPDTGCNNDIVGVKTSGGGKAVITVTTADESADGVVLSNEGRRKLIEALGGVVTAYDITAYGKREER